jgi:chemotaxis protein MotB
MSRKKKAPAPENHERWLVSYADFITLLFAFFVVMFASSQTDRGKAHQVSESVRKALEEGQIVTAIAGILGGTTDDKGKGNAMMRGPGGAIRAPSSNEVRMVELLPSQKFLDAELKSEIQTGKVQVHMEQRGLVVSLSEAAFFPPGGDSINAQAHETIGKIAGAIVKLPNPVRLEGHTDSVPIHNSRFQSNWELSAARSIAMLELLSRDFEVPRHKLAIAGYAETCPVASNETEEGRARNRRVDVVILNNQGAISEPVAAPPKAAEKPSPFPEKRAEEKRHSSGGGTKEGPG